MDRLVNPSFRKLAGMSDCEHSNLTMSLKAASSYGSFSMYNHLSKLSEVYHHGKFIEGTILKLLHNIEESIQNWNSIHVYLLSNFVVYAVVTLNGQIWHHTLHMLREKPISRFARPVIIWYERTLSWYKARI